MYFIKILHETGGYRSQVANRQETPFPATRCSHLFLFLWLALSGIAGSPTPCFADASVTVKPEVEINRLAVRLSDLFVGVPAEIDRDIAQAPPPCKPAVYDSVVLNKLADTYRLDLQSGRQVDHAVVSSACTRISADMIREAVIDRVKADTQDDPNARNRSYEVIFDLHNLEVDLPGNAKPDYQLENFTYDSSQKSFRATLAAQTPRGPYNVPVTGRILAKRHVPILAHRLENGTTIGANDLDWTQVPEDRVTADIITEPDQLVGRELRRDTAEGEIIHSHDVIPPRLVQRGALVTIRVQTPYISVATQGKAQQDGAQGDVVRVVNTQSNRIVEGVVTGPGIVEIRTTQSLASAE